MKSKEHSATWCRQSRRGRSGALAELEAAFLAGGWQGYVSPLQFPSGAALSLDGPRGLPKFTKHEMRRLGPIWFSTACHFCPAQMRGREHSSFALGEHGTPAHTGPKGQLLLRRSTLPLQRGGTVLAGTPSHKSLPLQRSPSSLCGRENESTRSARRAAPVPALRGREGPGRLRAPTSPPSVARRRQRLLRCPLPAHRRGEAHRRWLLQPEAAL